MTRRADVPRIKPTDVFDLVEQGDALLICAYSNEDKCRKLRLESALTLGEFKNREPDYDRKDIKLVFY